jgi:hypothetical protein
MRAEMWGAITEIGRRTRRLSEIIASAHCILNTPDVCDIYPAKDTLPQCLDNMQTELVSPEMRVFIESEIVKRQETDEGRTALSEIAHMRCKLDTDIRRIVHVEHVLSDLYTYLGVRPP